MCEPASAADRHLSPREREREREREIGFTGFRVFAMEEASSRALNLAETLLFLHIPSRRQLPKPLPKTFLRMLLS